MSLFRNIEELPGPPPAHKGQAQTEERLRQEPPVLRSIRSVVGRMPGVLPGAGPEEQG